MKVIAELVDMIQDELEGAERYALCSMRYKADHPKLAQRLNELAGVEMQHVRALHTEVERIIDDQRANGVEPPAGMMAVYEYEHERQIKKAAQVKSMIDEFDA